MLLTLGTVEGAVIHLKSISIEPCVSATIAYSLYSSLGNQELVYVMEGEQYKKWGTDDTLIYHLLCAKHKLHYKPYVEPEFFEEVMVSKDENTGEMKYDSIRYPNPKYNPNQPEYKPPELPPSTLYDDSRSIHNDSDIQRISSLETELEEQRKKLATIISLLGKTAI